MQARISKTGGGWLGEVSGATADLGTFLPLVLGVLAVRGFDGTGVLVGFGLFALAVAAVYRRPIPIQPMKAVAALIIVGAITPAQAMASGLIVGGALLVLALTGVVARLARVMPASVILGVQLGVGAQLALIGVKQVGAQVDFGIPALALLGALYFTPYRFLGAFLVVTAAALVFMLTGTGGAVPEAGLHLPLPAWPAWADFRVALTDVALPQLALTLSNAVLATAAIAGDYFPQDRERLGARPLALSTGVLNLALAPFGALPMCHGSGGLVAQVGFGARTWGAPALFGLACLGLGVVYDGQANLILGLVPLGAVGAILAVAGAEMAVTRRLLDARPSCRVVIVITGLACITTNMAVGLLAGLAAEGARSLYVRRFGERV